MSHQFDPFHHHSDPVEAMSQQLALELDRGRGESVATFLQQEFYDLPPQEFKRLIYGVMANEHSHAGFDLHVEQDGSIVMSSPYDEGVIIGNMLEQAENYAVRRDQYYSSW